MGDLQQIVERSAGILATEITAEGRGDCPPFTRHTPDRQQAAAARSGFCRGKHTGTVDDHSARGALDMLSIDKHGFDQMDRRLLLALIEKFSGGPVGIESLAAALSEERDTLEEVVEPYLIQQGFIMRTPRGRVATQYAYRHFGMTQEGPATDLFDESQ